MSSPPDATTKAEILDDGQLLQVHHQGHTESLVLPAKVSVSTALPVPSGRAAYLTWRVPVSAGEHKPSRFTPENQALPWNSIDIAGGSPIICRQCKNTIVGHGKITSWKDLPSENWAEMMEFWHCHKPHDHAHGEQDDGTLADNKGYGANNVISAQDGIGFVDLASFMFSESDCSDLTVSHPVSQPVLVLPHHGKKEGGHVGASHSMTWKPIQLPDSNHRRCHMWTVRAVETILSDRVQLPCTGKRISVCTRTSKATEVRRSHE